jgi:hypothetical protein
MMYHDIIMDLPLITIDVPWFTMIYFQHPSAESTDCDSKPSSLARLVALLRGDLAEPEAATGGVFV